MTTSTNDNYSNNSIKLLFRLELVDNNFLLEDFSAISEPYIVPRVEGNKYFVSWELQKTTWQLPGH